MVMTWAKVTVKNLREGAQWCRENLDHNDWVAYESQDSVKEIVFSFRDHAKAVEFALKF
jgi:hypothetical protein